MRRSSRSYLIAALVIGTSSRGIYALQPATKALERNPNEIISSRDRGGSGPPRSLVDVQPGAGAPSNNPVNEMNTSTDSDAIASDHGLEGQSAPPPPPPRRRHHHVRNLLIGVGAIVGMALLIAVAAK